MPGPSATLSAHSCVLQSLPSLSEVYVHGKLPTAVGIWSISLFSVLSTDWCCAHGLCTVSLSVISQVIRNSAGLGCAKASLLSLVFLPTANAFSDSPKVVVVVVGMEMAFKVPCHPVMIFSFHGARCIPLSSVHQ